MGWFTNFFKGKKEVKVSEEVKAPVVLDGSLGAQLKANADAVFEKQREERNASIAKQLSLVDAEFDVWFENVKLVMIEDSKKGLYAVTVPFLEQQTDVPWIHVVSNRLHEKLSEIDKKLVLHDVKVVYLSHDKYHFNVTIRW